MNDLDQNITTFFIIIVVIGVITAIVLSFFASQKGDFDKLEDMPASVPPPVADAIKKLPIQRQLQAKIANTVTQCIQKEVASQSEQIKQEISKHYQGIIEKNEATLKKTRKNFEEVTVQYEQLDKSFKNLGEQVKQTHAVVNSMAEGMIVVDEKGNVLMMNPAAEKMLGEKTTQKIGKPILGDQKDDQLISFIKSHPGSGQKEVSLQSASEETKKILRASNAIIENEQGQAVGMVSILSDVTKQKELDDMKSQFVASITHELRTPLAAIQESLSMMLERQLGDVSEEQQSVLGIAQKEIKRLANLINDILDFSKIEAGKLKMNTRRFPIQEVLNHVLSTFQHWAKEKKLRLQPDFKTSAEIEGDPDRLTQVITNLVGNALKFTPAGGTVTVGLNLAPAGDGSSNGKIRVSVQDTGIGIPENDQKHLFQKFYQAGSTSRKGYGGTGLGLAIAKEIVELHGGKIWVESRQGVGSNFIFELPTSH